MNFNHRHHKQQTGFIHLMSLLLVILLTGCSDDGEAFKFVEAIEAEELGINGIRIETNNPVINADGTAQYTAFGIPVSTTATEPDITSLVRWRVSDTSLASIDSHGLLSAKADGTVTVIAEFSAYSANFLQTINTANLIGLTITGVSDVNECQNLQLDAEGDFDDGTVRPVSDIVTWSITAGDADISTAGLLQTFSAGSVTVQAVSGTVSGDATINVNDSLQTITLSPLNPSIADGDTLTFSASGNYASGPSDITENTTWSSDNIAIASFANEIVTAISPGTATIMAECGGVTADTTLTVTEVVELQFVEINNGDSSVTVNETDGTVQLELTAEFTDGSRQIVTEDAIWSIASQSGTDLTISNSTGSEGEITIGIGTGTATIEAEYQTEIDRISVIVE